MAPRTSPVAKKKGRLSSIKSLILGKAKKKDKKSGKSAKAKVKPTKTVAKSAKNKAAKATATKAAAKKPAKPVKAGKAAAPKAAKGKKAAGASAKSGKKKVEKTNTPVPAPMTADEMMSAAEIEAHRDEYDADGNAICREVACESIASTGHYCRLHYIKNWKKIKRKQLILKEKKLNRYIEELVAKYPDKYIDAIRQDLANDKDFNKVITDLQLDGEIDEYDPEQEGVENIIDNIKRDVDDDGSEY